MIPIIFWQLLAAHQAQLESLMETLDVDRTKQQNSVKQRLAEKRRLRQEALKKKQGNELAKELLEQKKELSDAERNAVSFCLPCNLFTLTF